MNLPAVEHSTIALMYARRKAVRPPKVFKPAFSKLRPKNHLQQTKTFDASVSTKARTPRLFDTASSVITNDRYSRLGNGTGSQNRVLRSFDGNHQMLPDLSKVFRVRGVLTELSKSVANKDNIADQLTEDGSISLSLSMDARKYKKLISSSRKLLQEVMPAENAGAGVANQQTKVALAEMSHKPSEERLPGFKKVPNLPSSSVPISKKLPKLYCRALYTKKHVSHAEAAVWTHLQDRRRLEFELKSLVLEPSRNASMIADIEVSPSKSRVGGFPKIKVSPPTLEQMTNENFQIAKSRISTSDVGENADSAIYKRSGSEASVEFAQQLESRTHNSSRSGLEHTPKIKVVKGIVYESYKLPGSDKEHYGIKGFLANGQQSSNIMRSVSSSYDNSDFVELDRIEADGMQKDLAEADRMALVDFRNHEKYKGVKSEISSQQRLQSLSKTGIASWVKSPAPSPSPPAPDDVLPAGLSSSDLPVLPKQEQFLQWLVHEERRRKEKQTADEPQTVQAAVERCAALGAYRAQFQEIKRAFRSNNERKAARDTERKEIEKDRERTMRGKRWKLLLGE